MTLIDGRLQVPPENFHDITLVRMDFLNIIGLNLDEFTFAEIMKRNYTKLVPLQALSYTHSFHTKSTIFDNSNQGFNQSNCFQTQPQKLNARWLVKTFHRANRFVFLKSCISAIYLSIVALILVLTAGCQFSSEIQLTKGYIKLKLTLMKNSSKLC